MQKTYLSMINTQASYHKADLLIHLFILSYCFIQNSIVIIYHVIIVIHLYDLSPLQNHEDLQTKRKLHLSL